MNSFLKTGRSFVSHFYCSRTRSFRSPLRPKTTESSDTSDSSLKPSSVTEPTSPKKSLDLSADVLRDEWQQIIFHHTATPRTSKFNVEWCRSLHVDQRGWSDIGYHLYIEHDGSISKGRPLNRIGAHCSSKNYEAIGIAVCGGMLADGSYGITLTEEQKEAMKECVAELRRCTGKQLPVSGHRDHKSTLCPLFEVKDILDE